MAIKVGLSMAKAKLSHEISAGNLHRKKFCHE